MTKSLIRGLLAGLLIPLCLTGQARTNPPPLDDLISQVQNSLEGGDLDAYLAAFAPDFRATERIRIESFFNEFGMKAAKLKLAGRRSRPDGISRLFFQAFFENSFSAIIENWHLTAALNENRWEVTDLEATGNFRTLYKIGIPSGRSEKVRSVEITHRDIRISFRNPAVFYDNIPGMETALIVVGKGTVLFTPSDPIEKHQLELLYRKKYLEDTIDYVFIRCSNDYFSSNIVIQEATGTEPISESVKNKAYSVFARNYKRSFTFENPLDEDLLSFLPRGDEVVFEFKAKKAGELTYIYYPFSDEEVSLYDRKKDRAISLYHPQAENDPGLKNMFISFEDKYDIEAYDIEVGYTPARFYLTGKAQIRVSPKVESLDSLKFRFSSDLQILKIQDEEGRELFFTQDKLRDLLYVYFISPLQLDRRASIEVFYRGRMIPPIPSTDVIAQVGLNQKISFERRYETFLFTKNACWYPSPSEEDYFTSRLKIIVPPEFGCVGTGQVVEKGQLERMGDVVEIEKTGSAVYIYESKQPVKYLAFIVGKFDRQREGNDPIPLQTYISNEIMALSPNLFTQTKDVLDYYIRHFGPYPYGKLGIVLRVWPTSGGHSPPSFIVLNELAWVSDRESIPLIFDTPVGLFNWEEYFLAHEIAHQWWGQGVSFATYRDQWLSEGLAQFSCALYLKEKYGPRAYADILKKFARWTEKKSHKGPINLGARLSYFDYDAYQAIIYDKAALVLMMLHDFLGEDVFFSGLRQFFETYKFRAARTENFIQTMENVSGQDLSEFFQGWLYSYELPHVKTSTSVERGDEGFLLKVRVSQLEGRFQFPLWVQWTTEGEIQHQMVVVTDARQEFIIPTGKKPENVRVNPLNAVPGKFQ